MSILNRPGWANRPVLTEGRLHSDALKQRITNMFQRTTLGNSPTYAVNKIASILRNEMKDDDVTINDIVRIANSPQVTNMKFSPKLKQEIMDAHSGDDSIEDVSPEQPEGIEFSDNENQQPEISSIELNGDEMAFSAPVPQSESEPEMALPMMGTEDAEEKRKCKCDCTEQRPKDEPKVNEIIKNESVKLSPKSVNKLLQENYLKSKQHKFRMEERYRLY